jgi:hypothetical protein
MGYGKKEEIGDFLSVGLCKTEMLLGGGGGRDDDDPPSS